MWAFGTFCDEFYVNTRLHLKLDLDPSRETLLHFLEQIRRAFPRMTRLRRRQDGGLILDDDGQDGAGRRYVRVEASSLRFGCFDPPDAHSVSQLSEMVLTQAPFSLSLSELDYDYMDVIFCFDLEYRGNHDELVAEVLFPDHPLLNALGPETERIIDCQPFFGVTITPACDRQVYLEIKGRTSTYEVRVNEYEPTPLSVYLTVRHYWGFGEPAELVAVHKELLAGAERLAAARVVPQVVQPLAAAIASRR